MYSDQKKSKVIRFPAKKMREIGQENDGIDKVDVVIWQMEANEKK